MYRNASGLLLVASLATVACGADGDREIESAASAPALESKSPNASLREHRAQLDGTVWKDETTAQEFESSFIRLWDDLRNSEDAISVLAEFRFSKLILGVDAAKEILDHGIHRWSSAASTRDLNPSDWQQLLHDYRQSGWQLAQSEWHHTRFIPSESGPQRSEFGIVLHAQNLSEQRRAIIHGTIRVRWQDERDSQGHWLPGVIDASALEVLERRGLPAFSETRELGREEEFDILATDTDLSGTVVVYDLDGDGLDEIVVSYANLVFWNKGNLDFEEKPLFAHPPPTPYGTAVLADFTGDGVVDVLVAGTGSWPLLYTGEPGGVFSERGTKIAQVGARLMQPAAIAVGDIDGDQDLDLWVTDYKSPYGQENGLPSPYFDANDGFASHLLVNLGGGKFANQTEDAGLAAKRYRRTYSTSFVDLDQDGDLDLVVVSDFSGADVYLNDGAGYFTDVTDQMLDERTAFGMAGLYSDFNLDGALDFYMVGMSSTTSRRLDYLGLGRTEFPQHQAMRAKMGFGNRMYFGGADHILREADLGSAVARTGWSWGTVVLDFDLDADPDIYVANGHVSRASAQDYCTDFWKHDIYSEEVAEDANVGIFLAGARMKGISWNGFEHNHLLMNIDGHRFVNAGFLMGVAIEDDSRSVVSSDFDGDGRPDLLVSTRVNAPSSAGEERIGRVRVVRNTMEHDHHWIGIRLTGARSPIGARITVVSGDRVQLHYVLIGDGYRSQQPFARVFGLGERSAVDYVVITYPGGRNVRIENPPVDRYLVIPDSAG